MFVSWRIFGRKTGVGRILWGLTHQDRLRMNDVSYRMHCLWFKCVYDVYLFFSKLVLMCLKNDGRFLLVPEDSLMLTSVRPYILARELKVGSAIFTQFGLRCSERRFRDGVVLNVPGSSPACSSHF